MVFGLFSLFISIDSFDFEILYLKFFTCIIFYNRLFTVSGRLFCSTKESGRLFSITKDSGRLYKGTKDSGVFVRIYGVFGV